MTKIINCAIYTRKSHEEGLDQDFNSLDAQHLAGEHYIESHRGEGWTLVDKRYDDGGYSGGSLARPALQELLNDIKAGFVHCVVVYKIDRLSRSLLDFAKLVDVFDEFKVNFVSITQSFNTGNSMGRLILNILLSFAQFERELTGERIRDKFALSKAKGMWMGGFPPLGYDVKERKLIINEKEKPIVRLIYEQFLILQSITKLVYLLNKEGYTTKSWTSVRGRCYQGQPFTKGALRHILTSPLYKGCISHKGRVYEGQHKAIIETALWEQVQTIFTTCPHARARESASLTPPALLKGLIHCVACEAPLIHTYTTRRGKRYPYYVCNGKRRGKSLNCPLRALAAGTIESIVSTHVRRLLHSPEIIAGVCREMEGQRKDQRQGKETRVMPEGLIIAHMQQIDALWKELFPVEQRRIVQLLVERVNLREDGMEVKMNTQGLTSLMHELQDNLFELADAFNSKEAA